MAYDGMARAFTSGASETLVQFAYVALAAVVIVATEARYRLVRRYSFRLNAGWTDLIEMPWPFKTPAVGRHRR